ncbi:MAG: hypothetical protein V1717_00160 [Candidatus Micrarchaeota archaeon]
MQSMVSLAAVVYYLFLLVGGVGFGYFILRLTNPDVRLYGANEKLGASAVYGFVLFSIAFVLDFLVSGEAFFYATGFLPATIFVTLLFSIFALKVKNMFFNPEFLVVGVPVPAAPKPMLEFTQAFEKPEKTEKEEVKENHALKEITSVQAKAPSETAIPEVEFHPYFPPAVQEQKPVEVAEERKHRKSFTEFVDGVKQGLGLKKTEVEASEVTVEQVTAHEPLPAKEIAEAVWEKEGVEKIGMPEVEENAEEKARLLKKIKETELEDFAREIVGEKKSEGFHRRYQARQEEDRTKMEARRKEKGPQPAEVEFQSMVEEVYTQLQVSKKRAEVSEKLKLSPPPAEEKVEQQILEQRPSEEKKPGEAEALFQQPKSVFEQLDVLSTTTQRTQKQESDVKFVKLPANGAGCPRCHSNNSKIVFCPYCGSGMCANCSPMIKPTEGGFEYTCPKCGEGVFVKKQAS